MCQRLGYQDERLVGWAADKSDGLFADWLNGWLKGWLAGWLAGKVICVLLLDGWLAIGQLAPWLALMTVS